MASVVGLDVYKWVMGSCRLAGLGLVLGTVSCEDPQNMTCLVFHVVDSPLDDSA